MIRKADFLGLFSLNRVSEQSAWQALQPEQSPATAATTRMKYHFLLYTNRFIALLIQKSLIFYEFQQYNQA